MQDFATAGQIKTRTWEHGSLIYFEGYSFYVYGIQKKRNTDLHSDKYINSLNRLTCCVLLIQQVVADGINDEVSGIFGFGFFQDILPVCFYGSPAGEDLIGNLFGGIAFGD